MRFSSITIKNFRQYRDLHLQFEKSEHDLQIIIGDNGTGKTNLLNAFTWCLYGVEPHLGSDEKDKGEPRLNKEVIAEMVDSGISIEDVMVEIDIERDNGVVRVRRSVPFKVTGVASAFEKKAEECFSVVIIGPDGNAKPIGHDVAREYVDRFLPESIREYFFFDGEQLNNYFSEQRSAAIRSAVHSISQIDSVSRMRDRTSSVAKNLMGKARKNSPDLNKYVSKIQDYEKKIRVCKDNVEKDKEEITRLEEKIEELAGSLRGMPEVGEIEKRRDDLRKRQVSAEHEVGEALEFYCEFARDRYVDFAFYETAKRAIAAIAAMEKDNQLPPAIDPTLLSEMLSSHLCKVCQRPLSDAEETHIKELLDLYRVGTETSAVLTGLRGELLNLCRRVEHYPKDRKNAAGRLSSAQKNLSDIATQLADTEDEYRRCPNPDKVKMWAEQRKQFEKERNNKNQELGKHKSYQAQIENVLEKWQKDYEQAKRVEGLGDEFQVAGDFGMRAAKLLEEVEKRAIDETRELIEKSTEDLFKGLVWKDSKCDHVGLDTNYHLSLYDKYGYSCAGTCSAAERALLALSFTLAMHSVSGFDSPLFIDTPIARASGGNRANFAKTLTEVSEKKQLILTFTPDEYSTQIAEVFDPVCSSYMKLVLGDDEKTVTVRKDE